MAILDKHDAPGSFAGRAMSDLQDLLECVKRAEGPSRELDVRLGMFEAGLAQNEDVLAQIGVPGSGWTPSEEEWPRYTYSIDAALALVERLLPRRWPDVIEQALRRNTPLEKLPLEIIEILVFELWLEEYTRDQLALLSQPSTA